MRTTFSRIAKVMAGPLAIAFLQFSLGLPAMSADDDDKDTSRNSRQAGSNGDSRDSSGSNRDEERSNDRSSRARQSDQHHKALGVTLNEDSAGYLYVLRVLPGSPAEKAGLKKGDEILTVDDHRVGHTNELKRALARAEDDTVELGILRKGRHKTVKATLADTDEVFGSENEGNGGRNRRNAQNDRQDNQFTSSGRSNRRGNSSRGDDRDTERTNYHRGAALGIALDQGPRDGAWVTDVFPNSPADKAGIQAGDEIEKIDDQKVDSAEAVIQTISQKQAGDRIAMDIDRKGDKKTIKAKLVRHEDLEGDGQMEPSRRERGYGNDGSGGDDDESNSANDRETRRSR